MNHASKHRKEEENQELTTESAKAVTLLQGILDVSPGYIAYCEPVFEPVDGSSVDPVDFIFRVVNARMSQFVDKQINSLIGQRITEFPETLIAQKLLEPCRTAFQTNCATTFECPDNVARPGHWYAVTVEPLLTGIVIALIDITARKQAELKAFQQAEEIRATLDASLNSILLMRTIRNQEGQIVDFRMETANHAVIYSLFKQPNELVGRTLLDVFPGNVESGFFALYARVADTGQSERAEYYYQDENGFRGWFEVSVVRQETDLIVLTFNNVTAQREAQLAQQGQAQLLQVILDHSQTAISLHEPIRNSSGQIVDFQVVRANRQALVNWGSLTDTRLQESFLTLRPEASGSDEFIRYVRVIETGQPEAFESTYADRHYAVALAEADGRVVMSAVDVTKDRQYRRELETLNRTLQQSNEGLHSFAYVASHDLQEPLRKIQTFSDLLLNQFEDNLSDGERDMTRRISKAASRMRQLIKDLLTYSQAAVPRDLHTPVALNQVIEGVMSDLEMAIAETSTTVQVSPLPVVLGSGTRLGQLFQNLITNALKFRQAGRPLTLHITARPARHDELPTGVSSGSSYWLISVADNGVGFDEKYKDRVFLPFQRLHDATQYSGTGIGLAICQRVVESHDGVIDVQSRAGEGTTFLIVLPVYKPAD